MKTQRPCPPAVLQILLSLLDRDQHGYGIKKEIAERTDRAMVLGAATLYRSLQKMEVQGLIVETRDRPPKERDDERRRYYRLTPAGRLLLGQEIDRLERLVHQARERGLAALPPTPAVVS